MSESSEVIRQRIKSGELNTVPTQTPKKRSLLSRILTYPLEAIKILLGIDKDSLNKPTARTAPPPERPSIRDTYRVNPPPSHQPINPYTYDPVAIGNIKGYLEGIGMDGKGNHDCDHEH